MERGSERRPEVRVLRTVEAATEMALAELRGVLPATPPPAARRLVSFATGATFKPMLQWLHGEVVAGRLPLERLLATHLDEYEGFGPDRRGGMVHELCSVCPSIAALLRRGAFVPVPSRGDAVTLAAHEQRLQQLGGIALQFAGIGRNGHLAFHEPGVPWDRGYHLAELATSTVQDARQRFLPDAPPVRAITAGIATILGAARVVLCAFGRGKAPAVRAMLEGEAGPQCPASALRAHGNALVLLDSDAASQLARSQIDSASGAR